MGENWQKPKQTKQIHANATTQGRENKQIEKQNNQENRLPYGFSSKSQTNKQTDIT